jgi:hypothetical protein
MLMKTSLQELYGNSKEATQKNENCLQEATSEKLN